MPLILLMKSFELFVSTSFCITIPSLLLFSVMNVIKCLKPRQKWMHMVSIFYTTQSNINKLVWMIFSVCIHFCIGLKVFVSGGHGNIGRVMLKEVIKMTQKTLSPILKELKDPRPVNKIKWMFHTSYQFVYKLQRLID